MSDLMSPRKKRSKDKGRPSRAAGWENKDVAREEGLKQGNALVAGALDLGGATSVAADAAGVPSVSNWLGEAQADAPGNAAVGSILNPASIAGPIVDGVKGLWQAGRDLMSGDDKGPPKLMTRDEFMQARRKPRESLEDAAKRAEAEFLASPAYQEMVRRGMVTKAKEALAASSQRAKQTWREGQATVGDEQAALDADYKSYTDDYDKMLEAWHGRSFGERNPGIATAAAALGPLAAGLATRGMFNKVNKVGKGYVDAAKAARAENRMGDYAMELDKIARWQKGERPAKAVTFGLAAGVPVEARGLADVMDKNLPPEYQDSQGNWQRSRAQQGAEERLSDPIEWAKSNGVNALSGLMAAGWGAKMAGKSPRIDASSELGIVDNAAAARLDPLMGAQARINQANMGPAPLPPLAARPVPQPHPTAPGYSGTGTGEQGGSGLFSKPPPPSTLSPPIQQTNPPPPRRTVQDRGDLMGGSTQEQGSLPLGDVVGGIGGVASKPRSSRTARDLLANEIATAYQRGDDLDIAPILRNSSLPKATADKVWKRMQLILNSSMPREEKASIIRQMIADKTAKFAGAGIAGIGAADLMSDPQGSRY